MSIGFCRDNMDLNKNLIMMNKKKDYWIVDLFDGELYSHKNNIGDTQKQYIPDAELAKVGDVIGVQINLEEGQISYYKNSKPLGVAFTELPSVFRKGKVYPLVSLYKTRVSTFQERKQIQVKVPDFQQKYPTQTEKKSDPYAEAEPVVTQNFNESRMMFRGMPAVAGSQIKPKAEEPEQPEVQQDQKEAPAGNPQQ